MLRIIEGLSADTLGVSASGTVTPREYQDILIPALLKTPAEARLLFIAGPAFKGFAPKGAWEDMIALAGKPGITRLALVTSLPWLRTAAGICSPLLAADMAIFTPADLPAALQWLADGDQAAHHNFLVSDVLGPSFKDIGQVIDAEDRRHDNGIVRRQRKIRRKLRKSALLLEKELPPAGRQGV